MIEGGRISSVFTVSATVVDARIHRLASHGPSTTRRLVVLLGQVRVRAVEKRRHVVHDDGRNPPCGTNADGTHALAPTDLHPLLAYNSC